MSDIGNSIANSPVKQITKIKNTLKLEDAKIKRTITIMQTTPDHKCYLGEYLLFS